MQYVNNATNLTTDQWLEQICVNHGLWETANVKHHLTEDNCHAHIHLIVHADQVATLAHIPGFERFEDHTHEPLSHFAKDIRALWKERKALADEMGWFSWFT